MSYFNTHRSKCQYCTKLSRRNIMDKSILKLSPCINSASADSYRTTFTTRHGRKIYLSVSIHDRKCTITDCFYIDRNQRRTGKERYTAKPLKLSTFECSSDKLLWVIESELDKKFYGIEYIEDQTADLSAEEFIKAKSEEIFSKYRFLILIGKGEIINGLPAQLRTRLKNQLHRSIYVDLSYYKNGQGVINQCCYYDRRYKRQDVKITPPQLISCFFPYTNEGILNLINHEICCNFTHIIVTSGIDIDSNTTPLCGAV